MLYRSDTRGQNASPAVCCSSFAWPAPGCPAPDPAQKGYYWPGGASGWGKAEMVMGRRRLTGHHPGMRWRTYKQNWSQNITTYLNKMTKINGLSFTYLVEKRSAVWGVFGERRRPTHHGFVHAVAVIGHTHAPLVQIRLLLQKGAWR